MKKYSFRSKFPFLCFGTLFDVFSLDMNGLLNFHYKLSRVLSFVIHGVKYKNYKEHMVQKMSSLATL